MLIKVMITQSIMTTMTMAHTGGCVDVEEHKRTLVAVEAVVHLVHQPQQLHVGARVWVEGWMHGWISA